MVFSLTFRNLKIYKRPNCSYSFHINSHSWYTTGNKCKVLKGWRALKAWSTNCNKSWYCAFCPCSLSQNSQKPHLSVVNHNISLPLWYTQQKALLPIVLPPSNHYICQCQLGWLRWYILINCPLVCITQFFLDLLEILKVRHNFTIICWSKIQSHVIYVWLQQFWDLIFTTLLISLKFENHSTISLLSAEAKFRAMSSISVETIQLQQF